MGSDVVNINYALLAHNRTDKSPLHNNWLWQQITCTIGELRSQQARKIRQRRPCR